MYDYREERFYKLFLIIFIVYHCQKNRVGRNILSLKKFEAIYFFLQNPSVMKDLLKRLNLGDVKCFKSTLYDSSTRISDYLKSDNIGKDISYLCTINKIKLLKVDGVSYLESCDISEFMLSDSASEFLSQNVDKIKKLASLTESKLLKSIVEI